MLLQLFFKYKNILKPFVLFLQEKCDKKLKPINASSLFVVDAPHLWILAFRPGKMLSSALVFPFVQLENPPRIQCNICLH